MMLKLLERLFIKNTSILYKDYWRAINCLVLLLMPTSVLEAGFEHMFDTIYSMFSKKIGLFSKKTEYFGKLQTEDIQRGKKMKVLSSKNKGGEMRRKNIVKLLKELATLEEGSLEYQLLELKIDYYKSINNLLDSQSSSNYRLNANSPSELALVNRTPKRPLKRGSQQSSHTTEYEVARTKDT